ncbi:YceI family protein [Agriterribacter sp.]|uniref:YceI family protein n=1 Tax=Agriterribacter sp. TaxID=2821509 RepID=UPI002B6B27D6|nr:YceI family protein [Agriterribacter sp.]HRO48169.1 YceI family protein [Agriterribacter sp.]HRQ19097.1 YceI family protein [Agriterribacter sp.]
MKKLFSFGVAVLLSISLFAQTTWKVDPMHSKLTFSVTHLGISDVAGLFKTFDVTAVAKQADFSDAVFELSVDVASINTEVQMRDDHLRSADFFEVEKYAKMTFKSTSVKKSGQNKYQLTGDLTLHGITKPVTMDLWYRGTIENPQSKAVISGFQLTGVLKRSDFNIGPKFPAPMISDEVQIKADGEFIKQ